MKRAENGTKWLFCGKFVPIAHPFLLQFTRIAPPPPQHTTYKTHRRNALFMQRGPSISLSMCEALAWFGSSWLPWRGGRGRTRRTRRTRRRTRRGLSSLTPLAEHDTHQLLKGAETTFYLVQKLSEYLFKIKICTMCAAPADLLVIDWGRGNCNQFK